MGGFDLKGRVAVVTGGASGIGKAIAQSLADNGAHPWVLDLDGAAAEATAKEIVQAGGQGWALACDVSDQESVSRAFTAISSKGPTDAHH